MNKYTRDYNDGFVAVLACLWIVILVGLWFVSTIITMDPVWVFTDDAKLIRKIVCGFLLAMSFLLGFEETNR